MAIEWSDDGIVLAVKRFGETDCIVDLLTDHHGRSSGFVKGGQGRHHRPMLQPGNSVRAVWRSRLADQLGRFTLEQNSSILGEVLTDPKRLLALGGLMATLATALPEREPVPEIKAGAEGLLTLIQYGEIKDIAASMARLDLAVLALLGYGLDLSECAVTGTTEGLAFVSPKTGRAVCAEAAAPYANKLLILPPYLLNECEPDLNAARDAMVLTQFFLDRHIWAVRRDGPPAGRERFFALVSELAAQEAQ